MIITILQAIIFYGYVLFIKNKYGVLESISDSTYHLEGQKRHLFLAFCWSIAFLNLFQPLEVFSMIGCIGLCFTGITIKHRSYDLNERYIHLTAATLAIISTFVGLWHVHGLWSPLLLLLVAVLFIKNRKNIIWNVEVASFTIILMYYLILAIQ